MHLNIFVGSGHVCSVPNSIKSFFHHQSSSLHIYTPHPTPPPPPEHSEKFNGILSAILNDIIGLSRIIWC